MWDASTKKIVEWTITNSGGIVNFTTLKLQWSTIPTVANDLVNKSYADSLAAPIYPKWIIVRLLTIANVTATISSPTVLILSSTTVDSFTIANGDLLCFNGQSTASWNGVYSVTQVTPTIQITRITGFDTILNIKKDVVVMVTDGTYIGSEWRCNTDILTLGTSPIWFVLLKNRTVTSVTSVLNTTTPTEGAVKNYVDSYFP